MLIYSDRSIIDIAVSVGFSSTSHFAGWFRRTFWGLPGGRQRRRDERHYREALISGHNAVEVPVMAAIGRPGMQPTPARQRLTVQRGAEREGVRGRRAGQNVAVGADDAALTDTGECAIAVTAVGKSDVAAIFVRPRRHDMARYHVIAAGRGADTQQAIHTGQGLGADQLRKIQVIANCHAETEPPQ